MADNKLIMELDLENDTFVVKMNDAIIKAGEFAKAGAESGKGWGQAAIEINQALELVGKAVELVRFAIEQMGEAVKSASGHEVDVQKLNQTLSISGQYSEEASKHFQELAESISKTSNVSEKLVLQTAQVAARYTTTSQETERLTQAALRLSAATGIDAQSAVLRLGLSLDGINARLNRTIPGIGQLTEEQLKHGAAVDFVMNKYPNLDNTITTFDGRMSLLKNSFEKVSTAIGDMIVKSPIINKAIELIAQYFQQAAEAIEKFSKSGRFDQMIKDAVAFGQGVITYVIAPMELMYNIGKMVFDSFVLGLQSIITVAVNVGNAIVQFILPKLEFVLENAAKIVGIFNKELADNITSTLRSITKSVTDTTQLMAETTVETTKSMAENVNKDFSKMFDFSLSTKLSARLEEIDRFVQTAKVKQAQFQIGSNKKSGQEDFSEEKLLQAQLNAKLSMIESNNYAIENAAKVHEQVSVQMEDKIYNNQVKQLKKKIQTHQATYKDIEMIEQQHQTRLNQIRQSYNDVSIKNFSLGWQGAMANMQKQYTNFATITQTLATKSHSIISSGFIQMAKDHKFSMDAILGQFLSMIGETMIQWGTFDILASIWPPNPVGIATGAALIAGGAVLVGMGGGSSASAPSTPGGAGGDTSGGAIASPQQSYQSQMQQKSAQIIIQGDYLNSTQTQQHLTDIIRQSSDVTDFAIVAQGKSF